MTNPSARHSSRQLPAPVPKPAFASSPHLPRPSRDTQAVLAIVTANLIWGGSAVATKATLAHVPPMTLAFLRVAIALAVLWPLLARAGHRPATGRVPFLLGLTGVALFCGCQNLALGTASASTVALVNGGIPILTALLAAALLRERIGGKRLVGLLVALAGVATVAVSGPQAGRASLLGAALAFTSAASFAAYAVLGRRAFADGNALGLVVGTTRYGVLLLLPCALAELGTGWPAAPTLGGGLLLLYLGAGCSALAFVLAGHGLARLDATHAGAYGNLKPLVGVALAVAILGESVTQGQYAGTALAIAGIAIAVSRPNPTRSPQPRHAPPQPARGRPGTLPRNPTNLAPFRLAPDPAPPHPGERPHPRRRFDAAPGVRVHQRGRAPPPPTVRPRPRPVP